MSERHAVPARLAYRGEVPTQAGLVRKNQQLAVAHRRTLDRVDELVRTQTRVGRELRGELSTLRDKGTALDELEREMSQTGLISSLMARITGRSAVLERRSATEALVDHYEVVSIRLRRASAFSDDLRLCALELHEEVEDLHKQLADALANEKASAERILDIERMLDELKAAEMSGADRERLRDKLTFELRQEALMLELFRASAEVAKQHLDPARALRDTTMRLNEEMATFVLQATGTVNAAGRRIQALGMAADAPTVVGELQQSLDELQDAMAITESYVETTQVLLADVLPQLSARLKAQQELDQVAVTAELDSVTREHARSLAERALREAAEAEIEDLLKS
ncbi:MAG: hypothetical protein EP330_22820 [Deltaproteobacteria bacterium]|nr:MAG: hypothetical protein EP330_22820 [Deltaproteobacteria bacterium]